MLGVNCRDLAMGTPDARDERRDVRGVRLRLHHHASLWRATAVVETAAAG